MTLSKVEKLHQNKQMLYAGLACHRAVCAFCGPLPGYANKQLPYDALKIIRFDLDLMQAMGGEMVFVQQLAHAGKITQGVFVACIRA